MENLIKQYQNLSIIELKTLCLYIKLKQMKTLASNL